MSGLEKIPGAFAIIILGEDHKGRQNSAIMTGAPEGIDLLQAAATGNIITAQELKGWFAEAGAKARLPIPGVSQTTALAHNLNLLRVTADIHRVPQPRSVKLERLKRALSLLHSDLPSLIEDARQSNDIAEKNGRRAFLSSEQFDAVRRLYVAVEEAIPSFYFAAPGKRRQPWHDRADFAAFSAIGCWRAAGAQRVGVGKPTSPAVVFAALALERLGERDASNTVISTEAISKALSRRKGDLANHRAVIDLDPNE
jgi:hypothetical protein